MADWNEIVKDGAPRRTPKVEELEPLRPIAMALGDADVRRDLFALIREQMEVAEAKMVQSHESHSAMLLHEGGRIYLKGLLNALESLVDDEVDA